MKTNLEVIQNVVGQNMVSLEEKVKDVEKLVQECVEDPVENKMEDRMKTIEDRMASKIRKLETIN